MIALQKISTNETLATWANAPPLFNCPLGEVNGAQLGWTQGDYRLVEVADPEPDPPTKDELRDYAARKRWQVETGGIAVTIEGISLSVPTDERTRGVLTAGYVKASANPAYTVHAWKMGPGVYFELNATDIIALGDAVEAHVQACFVANEAVDTAIENETYTSREDIDGHAWPSNT
jgi:hypothetical protein